MTKEFDDSKNNLNEKGNNESASKEDKPLKKERKKEERISTELKIQVLLTEHKQVQNFSNSLFGFYFKWALTYVTALFVSIGWFLGKALDSPLGQIDFWAKVQMLPTLQFLILSGIIVNASFLLLPPLLVLFIGEINRYTFKRISVPLSHLLNTKVVSYGTESAASTLIQLYWIAIIILWLLLPAVFSLFVLYALRVEVFIIEPYLRFYWWVACVYSVVAIILGLFMFLTNVVKSLRTRRGYDRKIKVNLS